jgi:hypothetical protein
MTESWSFVVRTMPLSFSRTTTTTFSSQQQPKQQQQQQHRFLLLAVTSSDDNHNDSNDEQPTIKILANSLATAILEDHPVIGKASSASSSSNNKDANNNNNNNNTPFFNAQDRKSLKAECAIMIDKAIRDGLIDLSKLRDKYQRDMLLDKDGSRSRLAQLMTLNGIREAEKFDAKVDTIIGTFLNATADSRRETKTLALEDLRRIRQVEREKEDKKKKKKNGGAAETTQAWKKTNDAWDKWDDEW